MKRAASRFILLAFALLDAGPLATGCGEDECAEQDVSVQITVDGRTPTECASWELQVRACSTGDECDAPCGPCIDGMPDPACPAIDACVTNELVLPSGDYQVCVHAELVNGGVESDACQSLHVGGTTSVAIDVDTDDAFPCIRSWEYDGSLCCNDVVDACVPPGS